MKKFIVLLILGLSTATTLFSCVEEEDALPCEVVEKASLGPDDPPSEDTGEDDDLDPQ